jgi:hypothetical protein
MPSRPFASLQPLLWELQREIARGEQPVVTEWPRGGPVRNCRRHERVF